MVLLSFKSFAQQNEAIEEDKSWWNNWPRFTYYTKDVNKVNQTNANAMTVVHGLMDEGRVPFFRDHILAYEGVNTTNIQQQGIKIMAWLEGMGDVREFLIAVHNNGNGTYEQDVNTGSSKIIATPWLWDSYGTGVNAYATDAKWAGFFC